MKVALSLSFYHIPKFLKNDLIKRLEINIQLEYSFLNSQTFEAVYGGAKRDRTADLLRARQALSQLSYGPVFLQAFPTQNWWVWADSNCRPHPYQGCALTN